MDPFAGATAGSLFAPHPKAYATGRLSPSLHRQDSNSPMPTRPDTLDDPFFAPHIPHSAPIPHTSVPFAPTELAVLQRWSQVYHSHRARCPVGPPPGMPAAVYDIFERLGAAVPFAAQQQGVAAVDFAQDPTSLPSSQNTTTTLDETEAFRPEAWSSVTTVDSQPTPGLYRSPEGDATSVPSSSSPTNTIRSTGSARPAHVFGPSSGVRVGSSPSYGALDQHMRALELKRGMKKSAAGHGRNKANRTASAPIRTASGSKPSGSSVRSSPLVGMKSSSPSRQSSPLVGLGSGPDGQSAYEPLGFQTFGNQPQVQQATVFGSTDAQQQSFSFSAGYDADQSGYTEAVSMVLDAQVAEEGEGDTSQTATPLLATIPVPPNTNAQAASAASGSAPAKEKTKVRASVSASDRTDPNTMPDRNDPSLVIIDDPAALRGMRYEDFEPHMFIGRDALGTEYPRNLEPGAGHERIRCLLCKCGYAGPNGRSMWRRHVSQKHVILLAGKRGTVPKKKEGGIPDEAAVINTYMEKRERTLASKKRYASKKRMDQRNDRLAAQGFDASKVAADESQPASQETADGEGDEDGDDEVEEIEIEEEPKAMPLQDVPANSSEAAKPKLRLKPLNKPGEAATGPENALPPSSPLSPVPTTSLSVSPSEPVHPGPTFSFNTPGPIKSTYLFSPFDDDHRRGGFGVLGKAFGDDMDSGLGKAFGDEIKLGGVKRVRPFKSTARLDDDSFPLLGAAVGLSSPLRIGRAQSVGAVEQSPTRGSRVVDIEETGSEPETPRTNAAKVAARRLQLFALESPVANVTPMRRVPPRGTLTRSLTTPVMSTKLGSHAALILGQTPLADGEEELARALGLAPDIARHEHSEDSPVRKRKRGPNTPFPIYPSSRLRESMDDLWPPSPFVINTPAPAPKRARKDKNKEEGLGMDSYANEIIAGDLLVES
ncbi:unnamed protein product [Rhizoctonia solani]|uniref:Uncharacterized protein n=1 Tax=Rhizoctonia solani TaxID=456999 RepID=A0A8H3DKS1_9AGAM|nr:unnamed protein product [Rhizoctonia solani]